MNTSLLISLLKRDLFGQAHTKICREPSRQVLDRFMPFGIALLILSAGNAEASFTANLESTRNLTSGNFVLSWTYTAGYASLQERKNGGIWQTIAEPSSLSSPIYFTDKPYGDYEYRLKRTYEDCTRRRCNTVREYSETLLVSVQDLPPPPAPLHEQLTYQFEVRTGDFDSNGYTDVLIDRLSPGPIDGSMQTFVLEGGPGGLSTTVPTAAELNHARTFPINDDLQVGGADKNFDGFSDIVLAGLLLMNEPNLYGHDSIILYASGIAGQSLPLGFVFVDERYAEFFSNVAEAATNSQFYAENSNTSSRPVFRGFFSCPFQFYPRAFTSLWDCRIRIVFVGFRTQQIGGGYNIHAPAASQAFARIRNGDYSNGDPWWSLSQAMRNVIGVHSFGFQPDGTRTLPGYGTDLDIEIWDKMLLNFVFELASIAAGEDLMPPEAYFRHEYEVSTRICSTTETDVVIAPRTPPSIGTVGAIPPELCTVANVFCWARRNPAPRQNDETTIVVNGEPSVLTGNNPIQTYVFPGVATVVNETLPADVISGVGAHVLHDPYQTLGCAENPEYEAINAASPRCSYVHRQVIENTAAGNISIRTHGEGYNATLREMIFNQFAGNLIFDGVDQWIRSRLATQGSCVDDP